MGGSILRRGLGSLLVVLLAGGVVLVTGPWRLSQGPGAPVRSTIESGAAVATEDLETAALAAAESFLGTYVDPDGRVVRRDQGNDTVSEGQAYGMLIALGADDRARFEQIWEWTRANLQREDHLLSWRWGEGRVIDPQPASDADVLAAWALLLAAERFDPAFRAPGEQLAAAVLAGETVDAGGRPVLVAGPWARSEEPHRTVPGYFAPAVFASMARLTGDTTWDELAASSRAVTSQLVDGGERLVPDWATVDGDGRSEDVGAPRSGAADGHFGLDAARLYVWLATSCDADDRVIAAATWPFFRQESEWGIGLAYALSGRRLADNQHPVMWVAAAATAGAADAPQTNGLFDTATDLDRRHPSYYGSAWVALGRLLLTTDRLDQC